MLKRVQEIPYSAKALPEPFVAKDIRAFLNSGMNMAELSYPDHTAASIAKSAIRYRKKHGLIGRLSIRRRGEHVYLERKDQR